MLEAWKLPLCRCEHLGTLERIDPRSPEIGFHPHENSMWFVMI